MPLGGSTPLGPKVPRVIDKITISHLISTSFLLPIAQVPLVLVRTPGLLRSELVRASVDVLSIEYPERNGALGLASPESRLRDAQLVTH